MEMESIIYICDSNVTRSAAAKAITEAMAQEADLGIEVSSAGLQETSYTEMHPEMASALTRLGYSPGKHIPRIATKELLQKQDLILCFNRIQSSRISLRYGSDLTGLTGRIHTLPEFASHSSVQIPEPMSLIKETPLSSLIRAIPVDRKLRRLLYRLHGYTNPADRSGVLDVYYDQVETIERYVEKVIKRINS